MDQLSDLIQTLAVTVQSSTQSTTQANTQPESPFPSPPPLIPRGLPYPSQPPQTPDRRVNFATEEIERAWANTASTSVDRSQPQSQSRYAEERERPNDWQTEVPTTERLYVIKKGFGYVGICKGW